MSTSSDLPRVVIGIPTYNRAQSLRRAVESALAQDYSNLVVLISDNASTDETPQVCEALSSVDSRVTVVRHAENRGATNNFIAAFERAEGELFMWLADDDWLEAGYVARCAQALRSDSGVVLAGGLGRYYERGAWRRDGVAVNCLSSHPALRVLQYYRQVDDNAIFYGVMRLSAARRVAVRDCLGADWFFIAALAYQGKVVTVDRAIVHRGLGGASQSLRKMARALSAPAWQGRVPLTFTLAAYAARDIATCGVYADLPGWRRRAFGMLVSCWLCAIKPVQELRRRFGAQRAAHTTAS